jgi:hypothetical protein
MCEMELGLGAVKTDGADCSQQSVQQNSATRCHKCAYKKGLCAICGNIVLNVKSELRLRGQ